MNNPTQLSMQTSVEITDQRHLEALFISLGAKQMAALAEKLAARHKLPGMAAMAELLNAEASMLVHKGQVKNLAFAAKAGLNVYDNALVLEFRNGGVWLVTKSQEELDSEQPA